MNSQGRKSPIRNLAAGLLGFVGIVGLGSLVMMHHGVAAKAPAAFAKPAGADSVRPALRSALPAALPAVAEAPAVATTSPAPLPPAEARSDAASSAATPAQPSENGAALISVASPALPAGWHVDLPASASSSASASVAATAKPGKTAARNPSPAAKRQLPKDANAVASTVHYGVSGRSELMGRAAGPVYNFSGISAKPSGQFAADNAAASGALQQVDAVEKQIDASDASDEDKAKLRRQLDQVRATAAPAAP